MRKTFYAGLLAGVGIFGAAMWLQAASPQAGDAMPKKVIHRAVQSVVPSGYVRVGQTDLYVRQTSSALDFYGMMGSSYYGSTYSDVGYRLAMSVNGTQGSVDCLNGTTINGVTCRPEVVQQGEFARVIYRVTNATDADATVSLGSYADVMIGSNDRAPISRRIDTVGNTYGLSMRDGGGAQLCLLFGSGLVGVNPVSDFWFGYYGQNNSTAQMLGAYSHGSNWMQENGSYDSGMGWCWKDRTVPAGATVEFSYLIGVGDVNLEPNSSFAVTPDDPEGWNDLSRPHQLTLTGTYESPAGQNGRIDYAVEQSDEWLPLTDDLPSGAAFEATLTAMFTPGLPEHTIRFRTVDAVGNVSNLPPIVYRDVAAGEWTGPEPREFALGTPIEPETVACADFAEGEYTVGGYRDNVNAGTAFMYVEGVFPETIGRKELSFEILPYDISSAFIVPELTGEYRFMMWHDGSVLDHCPGWYFEDELLREYVEEASRTQPLFQTAYASNQYPGWAVIMVEALGDSFSSSGLAGNFTGTASIGFEIAKGDPEMVYRHLSTEMTLPDEDVTEDGNPHGAGFTHECPYDAEILYKSLSGLTKEAPSEPGTYEIVIRLTDTSLYEVDPEGYRVGAFSIYPFDKTDRMALTAAVAELTKTGWNQDPAAWDTQASVAELLANTRITVREGRIVGLDLSGCEIDGMLPLAVFGLPRLEKLVLSDNSLSGDLTQTALALRASGVDTSSVRHLDISGNNLSGNVGVLAALFPNLETLLASGNRISDVAPPLAETVTTVDLTAQRIDRVLTLNTSAPDVQSLAVQIPSVLLYDKATGQYRTSVNMLLTESEPDEYTFRDPEVWALQVRYDAAEGLSMPFVSPQNVLYAEKPALMTAILLNDDDTPEGSIMKVSMTWDDGDSNFVGGLTIADLQATILYAFGAYRQYPFCFTAADTYKDKHINVQDVVRTVDMLINLPVDAYLARRTATATAGEADIRIWMEDGRIWLHSDRPVAALSLRHAGDVKWSLDQYGLTAENRTGALVAYSLNGAQIPAGTHLIGEASDDTALVYAEGASAEGRDLTVAFCAPGTVSVDINSADAKEALLYRLDGIKATDATRGPVIRVGEGKSRKTIQ